ncbi:PARP-domain-containing protein [Stereum hirsutum FP-91666 SS1]|uniref:PARP-domain-containing protein n=1 Tax=Stereum hirsutum (strain FP-91666) TaxID=721885 RepID=UPI000440D779|nr:PARP-domain-containing protein [Stereum hirsutum FP-91666 SS1]EIM92706.1 PARP-domain-containing protein [Stereum hirsutum FP-91666 SS1]
MVSVIKRGAAPVDPQSGYVATHQVYASGGQVWDAMMNQTDVGKNANKFYVIQLLHPIGNHSSIILITRWGRVGESGSQQVKGPFPPAAAVDEFKKQFKSKTSTAWEKRHGMTAKKGKYMWLERAFEDEENDEDEDSAEAGPSGSKPESKAVIPKSTLAQELQTVCRLIFNKSLIDAHLSSMNYDANKLPLGKLAKSTILNGFSALKSLSEVIADPAGAVATEYGSYAAACQELTNTYYSIIPHAFGRSRPTVISDMAILKKELELVDALGDMEVAQKLIQTATPKDKHGNPVNPLDAQFLSLQLSNMEPINADSQEFKALNAYANDTHGVTHSHMKINIQHAYRVERESETKAWHQGGHNKLEDGNRMLLWHGSRTTNFAGILRQGLRIAPPEAPVSGYMFGKGVYFADMVSKSAGYCHTHLSDGTGLLLLCEVAAKPFFEQENANYNADKDCKANNKLCTLGLGQWRPEVWKDAGDALGNDALKGCVMPEGPAVQDPKHHSLWYNEYIVYDTSQIRLRYMIMFKTN